MNEQEFISIAKKDLDNLNMFVSKGYFETSDFIHQVEVTGNSLVALSQQLGGKNACKEKWE